MCSIRVILIRKNLFLQHTTKSATTHSAFIKITWTTKRFWREDVVLFYKRKSKGPDNKYSEEKSSDFKKVFKVVHQEVTTICFTKNENEKEDSLIKYDLVKINLTRLYSLAPKFDITAFINTKGQFVRKYQKEISEFMLSTE